jgi:hypothetical protein
VTSTVRKTALAVVLAAAASALAAYVFEGPAWSTLLMALLLIVLWTPVKGLLYRRLGGEKPYGSALGANASSEICGLPFHLGLSFWPLMGASFAISAAIETLALAAMGTSTSLRRTLVLGIYGSLVVHLITAGFFAAQGSLLVGLPFLVAGVALFHVPTFFPEEWVARSRG